MTGICKGTAIYPFFRKLSMLNVFSITEICKDFFKQNNIGYFAFTFLLVICLTRTKRINVLYLAKKLHVENCVYVVWLSDRKSASNISVLRHNLLM